MEKVPDPLTTAARLRAHVHHAATHLAAVLDALDAVEELANEFAPEDAPLKVCACGEVYDRESWGALEYCGQQDDETEVAELRHCRRCGSTISVVLGPSPRRMP